MRQWDTRWLAWLAATLSSFGVLEFFGERDRRAGRGNHTLTGFLRRVLGINPQHWRRWPLGAVFAAGLVVFGIHILTPWL